MESINQDLQASYNIIKLLEGSNIQSEAVFLSLPGIFAVLNDNDEILRGNYTLANYFGVDLEDILRRSFSDLFNEKNWQIFSSFLKQLRDPAVQVDRVEVELGIDDADMLSGEKAHYWHLRKMDVSSRSEGQLIIVLGEDISQLRESEKNLNEIFASIPLGIFTISGEGVIEEWCSSYMTVLLDDTEFIGKSITDVLFRPAMESLSNEEKDGVASVEFVLGQGSVTYDMLEPFFPKQIFLPNPQLKHEGRWLKITYQPVIYDDVVKRLLIILEDKTDIVKAAEMKKKAQLLEDISVKRVLQLKQVDSKCLHLYVKELNNLVSRLKAEVSAKAPVKQVFATTHSIKGIARVAEFGFIKEVAHRFETFLEQKQTLDDTECQSALENLFQEFSDMYALYGAIYSSVHQGRRAKPEGGSQLPVDQRLYSLFNQYNSLLDVPDSLNKTFQLDQLFWGLLSYHYAFASTLEEGLVNQANRTAEGLGKAVKLHFDWGDVLLKANLRSALNECLVHLINNAVDHGIETPDERLAQQKERYGNIKVTVYEKDQQLYCEVTDDGQGIDVRKIRETAIQKSVVNTMEIADMTDREALQLILHPGFSTSESVSETSGRGIGMEAIMRILDDYNGVIHIDSKVGKGSSFQLSYQMLGREDLKFVKHCYPLSYFKKVLAEQIETMQHQNELSIQMSFDDDFEKGVFYGDLIKSVVACTTFICNLAYRGKITARWSLFKNAYLRCQCEVVESVESRQPDAQVEAPIEMCRYFIVKDNGTVLEENDIIDLQLGYYFQSERSPRIIVGFTNKVEKEMVRTTYERIRQVAEELDVSVEFSSDKEKVNMLIYPTFSRGNQSNHLPLPGFTVSSSKKIILQDMLRGLESLVSRENPFKRC